MLITCDFSDSDITEGGENFSVGQKQVSNIYCIKSCS